MGTPTAHYLNDVYGLSPNAQAEWTPAQRLAYGCAVVAIAASDGLSFSERDLISSQLRSIGISEEGVKAVLDGDYTRANIGELTAPLKDHAMGARCLLYDAIKLCCADGYDARERASVDHAAAVLGVDQAIVRQLEALVAGEIVQRQLRHALLGPGLDALR